MNSSPADSWKRQALILTALAVAVCTGFALMWAAEQRAKREILLASYGPSEAEVLENLSEEDRTLLASYPYYAQEGVSCRECHWDVYARWGVSQHARANRPMDPVLDESAFVPTQTHAHGSFTSSFRRVDGAFEVDTVGPRGTQETYEPEFMLAIHPLRQAVIPFPGGRYQATEMAYHPDLGDWFNVYGEEDRQPHEWGFWGSQGMNWNTQCAYCHMTNLKKNYDPATDAYQTTWDYHGISCRQCHGVMDNHAETYRRGGTAPSTLISTNQVVHLCATCHTRREEMSDRFAPGDSFYDHFRPTMYDSLGVFYPDGQVREEDYEYVPFIHSTMYHAGISCLDCHDPHSGRLRLPVENNALCMSCHTPPGIDNAPPIDPTAHSFHEPDSMGNRCVECHMPETVYMARDPRRDHGFTIPDPLLTRELGIPNACNRCHQEEEETTDWAIEWAEKWYGERLDRPQRERTRLVAALERGERPPAAQMVRVTADQEIFAWRASMMGLLRYYLDHADAVALLRDSLAHEDPLVRSAAVRALADHPASLNRLEPLLDDPIRLVRMDAAWALRNTLAADHPVYVELVDYLNHVSDQPGGVVRLSELALVAGRLDEAENWMRRVLRWEPRNPLAHHGIARVLSMKGEMKEALAAMNRAAAYEPSNPDHAFGLALLHAETGDLAKTEALLRTVVSVDPDYHRAWYNLGLALAGSDRLDEAVEAITRAETSSPRSAEYPYARATLHARQDDIPAARAAAQKALTLDPSFQAARTMLNSLPPDPGPE